MTQQQFSLSPIQSEDSVALSPEEEQQLQQQQQQQVSVDRVQPTTQINHLAGHDEEEEEEDQDDASEQEEGQLSMKYRNMINYNKIMNQTMAVNGGKNKNTADNGSSRSSSASNSTRSSLSSQQYLYHTNHQYYNNSSKVSAGLHQQQIYSAQRKKFRQIIQSIPLPLLATTIITVLILCLLFSECKSLQVNKQQQLNEGAIPQADNISNNNNNEQQLAETAAITSDQAGRQEERSQPEPAREPTGAWATVTRTHGFRRQHQPEYVQPHRQQPDFQLPHQAQLSALKRQFISQHFGRIAMQLKRHQLPVARQSSPNLQLDMGDDNSMLGSILSSVDADGGVAAAAAAGGSVEGGGGGEREKVQSEASAESLDGLERPVAHLRSSTPLKLDLGAEERQLVGDLAAHHEMSTASSNNQNNNNHIHRKQYNSNRYLNRQIDQQQQQAQEQQQPPTPPQQQGTNLRHQQQYRPHPVDSQKVYFHSHDRMFDVVQIHWRFVGPQDEGQFGGRNFKEMETICTLLASCKCCCCLIFCAAAPTTQL